MSTTAEMKNVNLDELDENQLQQLLEHKKKVRKQELERKQRDYGKKRDEFIRLNVAIAQDLAKQLKDLKEEVITRGNDLHDTMYEVFERDPKDLKTFSLITDDGKFKLELDSVERQQLNETAEVHIAAIKEVLQDKFAARNKVMYNIINDILIKNKAGDYDERLVARLRKHESDIDDQRFSDALDGLAKAYYVTGTSTYARFYQKDEESNGWKHINIQFSSL